MGKKISCRHCIYFGRMFIRIEIDQNNKDQTDLRAAGAGLFVSVAFVLVVTGIIAIFA